MLIPAIVPIPAIVALAAVVAIAAVVAVAAMLAFLLRFGARVQQKLNQVPLGHCCTNEQALLQYPRQTRLRQGTLQLQYLKQV